MHRRGTGRKAGLVAAAAVTLAAVVMNARRHPRPTPPRAVRKEPAALVAEPVEVAPPADPGQRGRRLLADVIDGTVIFLVTTTVWLSVYAFAPRVIGWQPRAVISGSMMPSIRPGDVVVVRPGMEGVTPGTLVTFHDRAIPGRILTHRVVQVNEDGTLTTKGDANQTPDSTPVAATAVIGQPRLVVPLIGLPAYWRSEGQVPKSAWASLAVVVALLASRHLVRPSRSAAAQEPVASGSDADVELPGQRDGDTAPDTRKSPVTDPAQGERDVSPEPEAAPDVPRGEAPSGTRDGEPPSEEESWESASASP